jgi:uncharacterized protein
VALVIDSGVLYAAIDRRDADNMACARLLSSWPDERIIPSPVLVEVEWLLSRRGLAASFVELLRDIDDGGFVVRDLPRDEYLRAASLMERYGNFPLGFVDAVVLAAVERLGESKVATLDHRHFRAVRLDHIESLELLPG